MQDYSWPGGLIVLQYVAENWQELVAECRGYDVHGNQILWFVVVDKSLAAHDPEVLMTIGVFLSFISFHLLFHLFIIFLEVIAALIFLFHILPLFNFNIIFKLTTA